MDNLKSNVYDCALVFEGGGYRAGYTAAMANVLLANGIYFNYVCGVSAGASNTVDYLSRDQYRTEAAFASSDWVEGEVGLPSVMKGTGYFNADALYEGAALDGRLPFDWDTFINCEADYGVQAFDAETGETRRFSKADTPDMVRLLELVRASSTVPAMMHPKPVDGRVYFDGGLGEGAGIPVNIAEAAGYEKFVLITTRPRGYRKQPMGDAKKTFTRRYFRKYPALAEALITRPERYNAELDRVEQMAEEGRCLILYPNHMDVHSGTTDAAKLRASYQLGWEQYVRELPRLREFVFGSEDAGPHGPDGWDGYITIG